MRGMHSSPSSNFSCSAPGEWSFCEAAILPWPATQLWTSLEGIVPIPPLQHSAFYWVPGASEFKEFLPVLKPNSMGMKKKSGFIFPEAFLDFYAPGRAALAEGEKKFYSRCWGVLHPPERYWEMAGNVSLSSWRGFWDSGRVPAHGSFKVPSNPHHSMILWVAVKI